MSVRPIAGLCAAAILFAASIEPAISAVTIPASASLTGLPSPAADPAARARALLRSMGPAADGVRDYEMTLVKQEWSDGSLQPEESLVAKWARPTMYYFKRLSPPHAGREILFVDGWNADKLRVSLGTWPNIRLNLDPFGSLAMSGANHPITETSLVYLVEVVLKNFEEADRLGVATVRQLGDETILGRATTHVQLLAPSAGSSVTIGPNETLWDVARRTGQSMSPILHANEYKGWKSPSDAMPGDSVFVPRFYASRIDLWIDKVLDLPLRAMIYDAKGRLFERFEHRDLKVNVGLTARDFSEKNPDYKF
jgi:hypothetical protein